MSLNNSSYADFPSSLQQAQRKLPLLNTYQSHHPQSNLPVTIARFTSPNLGVDHLYLDFAKNEPESYALFVEVVLGKIKQTLYQGLESLNRPCS